ncbi:MAG: hypothetical protein ACRD43_04150 [Pyrinomonadaceae bacterium]
MLTVWRRVHIEIDSMGNVSGNSVSGTLTDTTTVASGDQTLNLSLNNLEPNRFESGRLVIKPGTLSEKSTPVIAFVGTNTANTANSVTISNTGPSFQITSGDAFTLYDDDDFDDSGTLDGDDGAILPEPDTSVISDTDLPCGAAPANNCNVLAPAYIIPKYDLSGSHGKTGFILNLSISTASEVQAAFHFDNSAVSNIADFWAIYLSTAYQASETEDGDPNGTQATLGVTDSDIGTGQGSLLFLETNRNTECDHWNIGPINRNYTVAHEVGHKFGGEHQDLDLMRQSKSGSPPIYRTVGTFSDVTLDKMRRIINP